MLMTDSADRAAHQHRRIGGLDRRLSRHRKFELPSASLRMELLDDNPRRMNASIKSRPYADAAISRDMP
jgi:hypothetical protein